uniref:Uncharacterized protein n=1 Tax=Peronospora matthiolae TaxID=2874970 RepID=A0AAV1TQN9_9STRA
MDRSNCVGDSDGKSPRNPVGSTDGGPSFFTQLNRVLERAPTRVWKEHADDDLRPMIPLEKEALAA